VGGWYIAGNILVGGLIGWFIVDPITGAMWNLEPENVEMALTKIPETKPAVKLDSTPAPLTPTSATEPKAIFIK